MPCDSEVNFVVPKMNDGRGLNDGKMRHIRNTAVGLLSEWISKRYL